jgi:hypothetical protein
LGLAEKAGKERVKPGKTGKIGRPAGPGRQDRPAGPGKPGKSDDGLPKAPTFNRIPRLFDDSDVRRR